jgi:hypothetical protein
MIQAGEPTPIPPVTLATHPDRAQPPEGEASDGACADAETAGRAFVSPPPPPFPRVFPGL